jgi:hypothetical protein
MQRLTSRKSLVQMPANSSVTGLEYVGIGKALNGYRLKGDTSYRQAVISTNGRVWFEDALERDPQICHVLLREEKSVRDLDQETLDRLVVRLGRDLQTS